MSDWYTDFAGIGPNTVTFQGGDLNNADNWLASDGVTTGFPRDIDEGIVNVDGNGVVNFFDISPFIEILSGS